MNLGRYFSPGNFFLGRGYGNVKGESWQGFLVDLSGSIRKFQWPSAKLVYRGDPKARTEILLTIGPLAALDACGDLVQAGQQLAQQHLDLFDVGFGHSHSPEVYSRIRKPQVRLMIVTNSVKSSRVRSAKFIYLPPNMMTAA